MKYLMWRLSLALAALLVQDAAGARLGSSVKPSPEEAQDRKLTDGGYVISNEELQTAVSEWCSDEAAGEAKYGHISTWKTGQVTSMKNLFRYHCSTKATFNADISNWDVSSVTDMEGMFREAASFNGDLSSWDVSSVTEMQYMFQEATSFNGDLSSWDVSSVADKEMMFRSAYVFDETICCRNFVGSEVCWYLMDCPGYSGTLCHACFLNAEII